MSWATGATEQSREAPVGRVTNPGPHMSFPFLTKQMQGFVAYPTLARRSQMFAPRPLLIARKREPATGASVHIPQARRRVHLARP
jgi:hypothetical protein